MAQTFMHSGEFAKAPSFVKQRRVMHFQSDARRLLLSCWLNLYPITRCAHCEWGPNAKHILPRKWRVSGKLSRSSLCRCGRGGWFSLLGVFPAESHLQSACLKKKAGGGFPVCSDPGSQRTMGIKPTFYTRNNIQTECHTGMMG